MRIEVSRYLVSAVAAVFSLYIIALGAHSFDRPAASGPVIVALVLYGAASAVSLLPVPPARMPAWMAAFSVGVVVVMTLAVSAQLRPDAVGGNGYATWYVGAAGTLLAITAARRRFSFAWAGAAFLVLHTVAWSGVGGLISLGVLGSVAWVAAAHLVSAGMDTASADAQRFALAEREATLWQAAQEAHVHERQFRLGQTSAMALGMLRQIEESVGDLSDEQRAECLHLEGAIRDEIRGRHLLNDAVRREVMVARRRGATVTLLDEGGIDDLAGPQLERVQARLAEAIAATSADKVIARTVTDGTDVAVTVVGLRSGRDAEGVDDEVELWLEIPRRG